MMNELLDVLDVDQAAFSGNVRTFSFHKNSIRSVGKGRTSEAQKQPDFFYSFNIALQAELQIIQAQYDACLWYRTQPEYQQFDATLLQVEAEAFARMEKRMAGIQLQLLPLKN